jgi:hypothetical protein
MTTFQFALLCIATVIVCASGALVLACVFPGMPEDTEIFGGSGKQCQPSSQVKVATPVAERRPLASPLDCTPNFGTRPMDGLGATDYSKAARSGLDFTV